MTGAVSRGVQGDECRKTQCTWYLGNEACSPSGGEYVQRCIGSPREDTSQCKKCAFHPNDPDRRCRGENEYIIQKCGSNGREEMDVSMCATCRWHPFRFPR